MANCKNVVVIGANRGIGLELVKQILSRIKPDNLFATYRDPATSQELLDLASQNGNLHPLILDVRATEKYGDFVAQIDKISKGAGINLLINNSGVAKIENNSTLSEMKKEDLLYHLEVNTVAPIMLTQALLPLLEKASAAASNLPLGIGRAAVVQISTNFGSIGDNTSGGAYSYRISKAALNQASKTMSIDLIGKGILVIPLHPGWVKTELGGPNALITTEESVSGILNVVEQLNEGNTGHFMRFDGNEALW